MKPIKKQAIATFDKIVAPATLAFLSSNPPIILPLMAAYGFFGVVMHYKQDEVNEWVKIVQENPGVFTKEIVETKEFRDGFIVIFERYLKERNEEKRKIIKNIFLGFTNLSEDKKERFELERILEVIHLIGNNEVTYIKNHIKGTPLNNIIKVDGTYYSGYDSLKYLENLGVLRIELLIGSDVEKNGNDYFNGGKIKTDGGGMALSVEIITLTKFGKKFIKYITK